MNDVSELNEMHGLVFRDYRDKSLNIAIFSPDKDTFTEIYNLEESVMNKDYEDLSTSTIAFVEVDATNPDLMAIKFLLAFDFISEEDGEEYSTLFIQSCYSDKNPTLILDTFASCIRSVYDKNVESFEVGGLSPKLNS